jgi:hypothetical protein
MSFKDMKKKSSDFSKIQNALEKQVKGAESYKDDRFWKPELDSASNGYAVIRFLPPVEGEEVPWVRVFNHGFQGKGGWFIENCPTTIGGKCPVCEANSELWNSGSDDDKEIARARKRKLTYISNVLVVSDPKNPQNEGKVFLFKYGKKIFDKIMEKLQPEFDDESAVNVFDYWKGADFKLKIRKVAGYVNYDKSEFDTAAPLFGGDDAKLEGVWKQQHKLQEFVQTSEFKSYEELSTKMKSVLKESVAGAKTAEDMDEVESQFEAPKFKTSKPPKMAEKKAPSDDAEEEDAASYFERLANEE